MSARNSCVAVISNFSRYVTVTLLTESQHRDAQVLASATARLVFSPDRYVARSSEAQVSDWLQFMATLALSTVAMAGGVLLRRVYRGLQADGYGDVRWLGI